MNDMTRDQQLLDEFKEGLEKDGPVVLAQRVAQLETELKTANALLDEDNSENADAIADLTRQLDEVRTERDAAIARAEKAEGGEKRAKASLTKATTPAKPRKLGAIADDKVLDKDDLRKAIDDADEVQIAFSDGTREVLGIPPINVTGDAWGDHQFGTVLKEAATIEGPREGSSVTIDGYALLLDGKQVAYSRRSTPLQVAPGQRVSLANDIIF